MLFNSYTFILFFAAVLAIHNLPFPWRVKKINLLTASYLFYAAWNPPYVLLLIFATVVDWQVARLIDRSVTALRRKLLLAASLAVNLGLLASFKYAGFLLDNFVRILSLAGIPFTPAHPDIILPVGISFYMFQTLSYTIDIYRRNIRPWPSFLDYALYVSFFPQLVAGPIVRANYFLPQCAEERLTTAAGLGWGLYLLTIGLFQKIVLADGLLAPVADTLFESPGAPGTLTAWAGTLAFSGQIFFDFAGYSTCAIGIALCLGFHLPDNFRFPYAAAGFTDFWRRWHMSLSSWLRDYLYISLGGNRKGTVRTYVNILVTMLLGGLWHGASWTFVAWGGLHGLYLVIERLLKRAAGVFPLLRSMPAAIAMLITYLVVTVTWTFFRSDTFPQALGILRSLAGQAPDSPEILIGPLEILTVGTITAGLVLSHWYLRDREFTSVFTCTPVWVRSVLLTIMFIGIATLSGEDRAFIYFQF